MKKIILTICIALIGVAIYLFVIKKNNKSISLVLPTNGITLDGLSTATANSYVENFYDDNTSSDTATNVWFSDNWVSKIKALLDNEKETVNIDGIRIYFAKKENGQNTVVVVSTVKGGSNVNAPSKADHQDYYEHTLAYLNNLNKYNNGTEYMEEHDKKDSLSAKLYLYKCPCVKCDHSEKDNNHISCAEAYDLVSRFKKKTINTLNEWFPISVIDSLDAELIAAKAKHVPADGVRIYFAKNKKKRNVFVFTTTKDVAGMHVDYYERYNDQPVIKGTDDHGEECPINCTTVSLPQP
ncbi:hypothetical protein [Mucilaginibacter sp. OK283]|uniref:hypothetical protein n=1 Tax=Mucilaginibacter sp. OK283 TaxID=1881049 RepID=UPI0008C7344F|nr:hypothetical protein [Mucilaginibacter sp. OK283]SEP37958.1 hypothetical protein SAMN05428947_11362 [Mucilaginibacter sp. OK283]